MALILSRALRLELARCGVIRAILLGVSSFKGAMVTLDDDTLHSTSSAHVDCIVLEPGGAGNDSEPQMDAKPG